MNGVTAPVPAGERLLDAILKLSRLLEQENAALRQGDRGAIRALAEEKRLTCQAYEDAAAAAGEVSAGAMRERLRQAIQRLAETSAENRRRLAAGLAAHHRLMQVIAEALREQQPVQPGYAHGGRPAGRARQASPPPAFSFNKAL